MTLAPLLAFAIISFVVNILLIVYFCHGSKGKTVRRQISFKLSSFLSHENKSNNLVDQMQVEEIAVEDSRKELTKKEGIVNQVSVQSIELEIIDSLRNNHETRIDKKRIPDETGSNSNV